MSIYQAKPYILHSKLNQITTNDNRSLNTINNLESEVRLKLGLEVTKGPSPGKSPAKITQRRAM